MIASRRRGRALVAVLALALAVRVLNLWLMSRLPVAEYQFHWAESDMATSWAWSGRIISGDILGRDTPHQYTSWMREWAPLETWERWWGGRTVFHQAPLYAYALAAMRLVAGDGFWGIGLCQAMLVYGPFLLHETLVLRDTLGVTVSLLLLWWLAGCNEARALPWLVAGWLFALALLAREATLVFGPFVALWIARRFGRHPRALATVALAFVSGISVGLAPLVARNLVVGAPPLSLSTRGIETFVHGNAADSSVIGLALPAATRSILEQADGRLATAIRLTLATYQGDWLRLVGNELFKLRAIFARYEGTDNVNWYYFADRSPLLRFSLHFEWVLALGLVGLWLDRQRAVRHRLLRYFLLASVGALMYSTIVGRYRLPAVAVLLLYAGVTVEWTAREVAAGRWRRAAIAGLAAVGVAAASAHLLPSAERRQRYRADEFLLAAEVHYRHGRAERAFEELRAGLDTAYGGPDQQTLPGGYPNLAATFTRLAHELGRDADAAATLERVAASHPADGELERIIGFVYRDGLGRAEEAEKHFTRARTLEGS